MTARQCTLAAGLLLLGWQSPAQQPTFDVASIKPNISGKPGSTLGPRGGGGFFAVNATLVNLLLYAYAPPNGLLLRQQIIGGPEWIDTDRFDLEARRAGGTVAVTPEQTKVMLRSLLEDRFQLKADRGRRELPVYNLVLYKGGPKLSADQSPPDPRQAFISFATPGEQPTALPRGAMRLVTGPSSSTLIGTAVSLGRVVTLLQSKADRIIVDRTGVTALIDVNIEFSSSLTATPAEAGDDPASPSIFTAMEGLGLKLESTKAPLDVLVIESVQKPSAN